MCSVYSMKNIQTNKNIQYLYKHRVEKVCKTVHVVVEIEIHFKGNGGII